MTFPSPLDNTKKPQQGKSMLLDTVNVQTPLSQQRAEMWLLLIPKVAELYTHLDNYTEKAELIDGHILNNNEQMNHLLHLLHGLYLTVREDKYFSYLLFGVAQIPEADLGAIYYRYGKGSLKPILYAILRFERECQTMIELIQCTERVASDYVTYRLDDELFHDYLKTCLKQQLLLIGLFDIGKHIEKEYPDVKSLREWLQDVNYFNSQEPEVRAKLNLLFEKLLVYAKPLVPPSTHLLKILEAEV